jgi:hypothetical protein
MEHHYSVKDFVFPCINRPVTKDSLSPYNLSLVEDGGITGHIQSKNLLPTLIQNRISFSKNSQ